MTPVILLAVDQSTRSLTEDDRLLAEALGRHGIDVVPQLWGERVPAGATIVIRSTWDYIEDSLRFREWLDYLDRRGATVYNETRLIRWNMHKGYLLELAAHDVPVVPTRLLRRGAEHRLDDVAAETGWRDVVIKPAVGGTSRLTVHAARAGWAPAAEHLRRVLALEDVIVQPFIPSIVTEGEISIVAIAGEPMHAVLKHPRPGDWRVQNNFGGSARRIPIDGALEAFARTALAALDAVPLYARVDVVRRDDTLQLLELELVEPELFFRLAPDSAEAMAAGLVALVPGRPDSATRGSSPT